MTNDFRNAKKDLMKKGLRKSIPLRSGTEQLLTELKKQYKLAIATSTIKEFTDKIVDAYDLRKYFETIVVAEDVKKGKPDPEVYLLAAKRLHVNPSNCIVIEDATNGISAAKNAKMKCIAIKDHKGRDLSQADYIIEGFDELTSETIEKVFRSTL